MTQPPQPPVEELSTVQLIERLQQQTTVLVKTEIANAVDELKTKGTRLGVGVGISGVGAILALFGAATLVAAAVAGLATTLSVWLSALIVAAVLLVVGGIAAAVGARQARAAVPPVPQHTADSVRQDFAAVTGHDS